jgi:cold shock CspA family protein
MFGTVVRYLDEKGYGFLRPDNGADNDIFFHRSAFGALVTLKVGDRLEYEIGSDPRNGRARAENLRLAPTANPYRDVA